jgi:hypothetical protein
MGDVVNFARPESDAEPWQVYAGVRDGSRVVFTVFDEAANADLQAGDKNAPPRLHVTMTPATARHWARTLLTGADAIDDPANLPPELLEAIRKAGAAEPVGGNDD